MPVATVAGDARLHKLTYAEDSGILSGLLGTEKSMRTAVGMGYDVHRLVAGKPLWIGGLEIAHSHGLEGHSNADVRSEEHTSELQSLMHSSYAVLCLKKKRQTHTDKHKV